jgi:hypothetical protein
VKSRGEDPRCWTHINSTLTKKLVWTMLIILHTNVSPTLIGLFNVASKCNLPCML